MEEKFLRPCGSKRAKLERSLRLEVKGTNVLQLLKGMGIVLLTSL